MIKFKKKINLKHIQDRIDILEQNIEILNNNILNLEICFNIHKHGLNIYGQERLTDIQKNVNCQISKLRKIPT